MGLERNLENRTWLLEKLKAEIVGPDPAQNGLVLDLDCSEAINLTQKDFYSAKRQKNGDEILWQDSPIKRYGAGILFPSETTPEIQLAEEANSTEQEERDSVDYDDGKDISITSSGVDESDNYDVTLANSYRPSAMGISFLADLSASDNAMIVRPSFAEYIRKNVNIDGDANRRRHMWQRRQVPLQDGNPPQLEIQFSEFLSTKGPLCRWVPGYENRLEIVLISRDVEGKSRQKLITVSLVNRQNRAEGNVDELCFFQSALVVESTNKVKWIEPYPEVVRENSKYDDEEEILRLIYRDKQAFAIGHGCAAGWEGERPGSVCKVWTESVPVYETPSTSADLTDKSGVPLRVSMRKLAGLDSGDKGNDEITHLVDAYKEWIEGLKDLKNRITYDGRKVPISDDLTDTASLLIDRCDQCWERIAGGVEFLNSDTPESEWAREAFKLANLAMLIAQLRGSRDVRNPVWDNGRLGWDKPIVNPDPGQPHSSKGYWRPFQIAFLLMSIKGICDQRVSEREIVDLIWFPTGGGKTEAYLGLTAFAIFYNRLSGRAAGGADVLMRYTLRLLTAQQFQRAGLLFCAMEHIRNNKNYSESLGDKPFRLGMWVGGEASPNLRSQARTALRKLEKDPNEVNPFILLKCPWCNSKFGPKDQGDKGPVSVYGYQKWKNNKGKETVAFRCQDHNCEFGFSPIKPTNNPLPISIIDEDIIDDPPSMVIGTVDKFALLAWKPEIRSLFGICAEGQRNGYPPSLIIQDELHLISGPLGSMVGAYETVIDELCTTEINGTKNFPKIVASTATISRAQEQVKALYARKNMMLFPPSGLEAGDSFFARESRDDNGNLLPGRLYAGVMCPGHGSLQTTQARVYAALLQYPVVMSTDNEGESARDPWWTLLAFFNSIRELGGAASLLVADTRDYLRVILERHGFAYADIRKLFNVIELTSRIRSDHIPLSIKRLEKTLEKNKKGFFNDAIEVCLASNIIEVGVDIDRLSLMTIIGQPKTTSQYIQVSSRVGRNPKAPGLDFVLFSQSKPRDRSHYESFRSYHQRLYAQVEPTSVTPFSPPAVERALPGIILAAFRQLSEIDSANNPRPFPLPEGNELRRKIKEMILRRVGTVDEEEAQNVLSEFERKLKEWQMWDPLEYGGFGAPPEHPPLMHVAGSRVPLEWRNHSWPVMSSLRNVDANCEAELTSLFNETYESEEGHV